MSTADEDIHRMSVLRSELGNISHVLYIIHKDPDGLSPPGKSF